MPNKVSSPKKQKKVKKGKKTKKTVPPTLVTMPVIDSDQPVEQSQSLLDIGAVCQLPGLLKMGMGGDGGNVGEASSQRPRPSATMTSAAGLSDEADD